MEDVSKMKSPGVFITEVDLSQYVAIMSTAKIFGILTYAQSGPINEITSVSSVREFEDIFGDPISAGGLACSLYLAQSSYLKVVRLAGSGAEARTVNLAGTATITDGEDTVTEAVDNALIISHKYKGTLFSEALTATVKAIAGATADKFTLIIKKDDEELLNKNYTIVKDEETDEFPYVLDETKTDFVFTLGTTDPVTALTPVTDAAFSAGNNGANVTDNQFEKACDLFDDAENIDLDILAAPGFVNAAAIARLVLVAGNRKDTVAILDTPQGLTPEEAAEFVNGLNTDYPIAKLDSTYAAIYYPWGYSYNQYSGSFEYLPPTVGMLPAMAKEYLTYDNWAPPAGIPRISISAFADMERTLNRKERDILYVNHINPICNYKSLGLTAFGQKTLQRTLSATDRLNVRFLINFIKKFTEYYTTNFLFSDINEKTFASWTQVIDKQMKNIKDRGGCYDYKITMDWTTVTDEYLNNNIMPGIIQVKPTKTAEFIPIDVIIRNRSDAFEP